MQKQKPYIGVSAVTTVEEADFVVSSFIAHGVTADTDHVPMVGCLMSHERPADRPLQSTRYVEASDVPSLIGAVGKRALTCIHYESADATSLAGDLRTILTDCAPAALQLNLDYSPELVLSLQQIHDEFPDAHLILQLRPALLSSGVQHVVDALLACSDLLSYVLIDPSCGTGKPIDVTLAAQLFVAVQSKAPHVTVGFAGGLSPENLATILSPLMTQITSGMFCIDAESHIRTQDDHLDRHRADLYIAQAAALFS